MIQVENLEECLKKCTDLLLNSSGGKCLSANLSMNMNGKMKRICELNSSTERKNPEHFESRENFVYFDLLGA